MGHYKFEVEYDQKGQVPINLFDQIEDEQKAKYSVWKILGDNSAKAKFKVDVDCVSFTGRGLRAEHGIYDTFTRNSDTEDTIWFGFGGTHRPKFFQVTGHESLDKPLIVILTSKDHENQHTIELVLKPKEGSEATVKLVSKQDQSLNYLQISDILGKKDTLKTSEFQIGYDLDGQLPGDLFTRLQKNSYEDWTTYEVLGDDNPNAIFTITPDPNNKTEVISSDSKPTTFSPGSYSEAKFNVTGQLNQPFTVKLRALSPTTGEHFIDLILNQKQFEIEYDRDGQLPDDLFNQIEKYFGKKWCTYKVLGDNNPKSAFTITPEPNTKTGVISSDNQSTIFVPSFYPKAKFNVAGELKESVTVSLEAWTTNKDIIKIILTPKKMGGFGFF